MVGTLTINMCEAEIVLLSLFPTARITYSYTQAMAGIPTKVSGHVLAVLFLANPFKRMDLSL